MNRSVYWIFVLFTTFLMGVAFPIGKIGLSDVSPFLLMGIRFVLAGLIMAVVVIKRPHPRQAAGWLKMSAIGLFQSAGVMGCAYYSMHWITSGESAILTCMNPLLVVILDTLLSKAKYRFAQWVGVVLGFAGVFATFGFHLQFQPGTAIGFMGALSFAVATLLFKKWGPGLDTWVLTAYQMLFGGIVLLGASVLLEHPSFRFTASSAAVIVWLAVLGSIVQFSMWYYLLQKGDPGKTSAYLFLVPLFGVISGWLLLGEKLHWYAGFGGALICISIFLVNWRAKLPLKIRGSLAKLKA
ncbi:DMT family transporter [Paenibacillus thalictri]|uniref:EamA/RhaT family transporter n=1 Tax=Paenibacillus thalictri TaxID=2527873 RepID=A0A4Q9DXR1_9BACL|nr:DMT family transporter [Paenibacillus thalictri]TBL81175.1 EamA/RhaT family transporter [Paenibacillus thalictri]